MPEHPSRRSIGDLLDSGIITATTGFPYGGHAGVRGGVPHVRPFNVTNLGDTSLDQIKTVPEDIARTKPRLALNDIVFNNTNSKELVGKCAIWEHAEEPVFSNHMTRIRVVNGLGSPNYLAFALLHHWLDGKSEMLARAHVAQASIIGQRFREIEVLWPDSVAQSSIALALSLVRRALRLESTLIERSARLKQVAMRELFTRGLRGEAQKESEVGLIPDSWECVQFASVREWLQYGTSVRCTTNVGAHPVLRIPNIEGGYVNPTGLKYCHLTGKEAAAYLLENGDLLFIRTNGVLERLGSCAVYSGLPSGALFASYLIRARIKPNLVPRFAAFFFGSERGTALVASRATPAADGKYNLNTGIIDSLPLPLPPTVEEQLEVVAVLEAIDQKIDIHKKKRAVLEDLFKALLHKLMTGEIRVSDLDLSALARADAIEVPA